MKERNLERHCCRLAESQGWISMKLVSPNRAGVPDRMFMGFQGRVIFVEFKGPKGRLSAIQDRTIRQFKRHGHQVLVVDDMDDFKVALGMDV